ncbi:MAG TPA: hypothetical protein VHQ41_03635 [Patescibacteria group bacterium]|jgi:hypothetical protein|nr:hypothetical protein [Patescibacteria group bacterium]
MLDQIKDKKLDELNKNLEGINRKMGSYKSAFSKGLLYGLGTIIGAGLAIILIGWFLNVIGVIPALKTSADQWRQAFQQTQDAKNFIPAPTDSTPSTTTTPAQ